MTSLLVRAGLVAVALTVALVRVPPRLVEHWYSASLYPFVQRNLTPVTNLVPFALFDLAFLALAGIALFLLARRFRRVGAVRAVASSLVTFASMASALYLLFVLLWGLNYRRIPLEEKLEFDPSRVTSTAAMGLARTAVRMANALWAEAHQTPLDERRLRESFAQVDRALGTEWTPAPAVPKRSLLEFYFRRAAIDGMTDPFFLEIILNPDLLPFERPFVLAHEWAHLSGHASESEASFVAWLACLNGDAGARYSAWLAVYGSASARLPRADRRALAEALEAGPREDLRAAARRHARAVPAVTRVARDTYDAYLRANRVEEGIESYEEVVRLILGSWDGTSRIPRLRARAEVERRGS